MKIATRKGLCVSKTGEKTGRAADKIHALCDKTIEELKQIVALRDTQIAELEKRVKYVTDAALSTVKEHNKVAIESKESARLSIEARDTAILDLQRLRTMYVDRIEQLNQKSGAEIKTLRAQLAEITENVKALTEAAKKAIVEPAPESEAAEPALVSEAVAPAVIDAGQP